jgi:RHS repeat-associated protein
VENGSPGTYGWLGCDQISSDALGGQLLMGVRAYNPNSGRFSQVDPIAGGSANAYDYSAQDPVNNTDLDGEYWATASVENWHTPWFDDALRGSSDYLVDNLIRLYTSLPFTIDYLAVQAREEYRYMVWRGGGTPWYRTAQGHVHYTSHHHAFMSRAYVRFRITFTVNIGNWRLYSQTITSWWFQAGYFGPYYY